jgi:hypothetical protein
VASCRFRGIRFKLFFLQQGSAFGARKRNSRRPNSSSAVTVVPSNADAAGYRIYGRRRFKMMK